MENGKKLIAILEEIKEANEQANISSSISPFVDELNCRNPIKFSIDTFNNLISALENSGYNLNSLDTLKSVQKTRLRIIIENHMKDTFGRIQSIFGAVAYESTNDPFMVPFANDLRSNNPTQFAIDTIYRLIDILESKGFDFNNLSPLQIRQLPGEIKNSFENISMNIFYNYADKNQKRIIDGFKNNIEALQKEASEFQQKIWAIENSKKPILNKKGKIAELEKKVNEVKRNVIGSTDTLRRTLFRNQQENSRN